MVHYAGTLHRSIGELHPNFMVLLYCLSFAKTSDRLLDLQRRYGQYVHVLLKESDQE
jgi:hypothetical protein